MDPDEPTVSAAYQGCSDKCTTGGNKASPPSTSQLAARASLVSPAIILGQTLLGTDEGVQIIVGRWRIIQAAK